MTRRQIRSTQAGAGRHRGRYRWPEKPGGECGPVTVTKADGTVEVQPAKKPRARKHIPRAQRTLPPKTPPRAKRRRPGRTSKVFAAAYPDTCCGCGELILPGTLVCYDQHGQFLHDNYVMPQDRVDPWATGPTEAQG